MEGYFNLKVKFVITVLLAVLFYVSYLYVFKEQTPTSFKLNMDCTEVQIKEGSAKANLFFERYFEAQVLRNPEWQSNLGRKEQMDEWTSLIEVFEKKEHSYKQKTLAYLEDSILLSVCLDAPTSLSARLLKDKLKLALDGYQYRHYNYPVNSMDGEHLKIVSLLINGHKIIAHKDAEAYIGRVQKVDEKIDELIEQLELRSEKNLILPKFLFQDVFTSIQNIMENQVDKPNLLISDFNKKIEKLAIDITEKEVLVKRLEQAFDEVFVPSYQKLYNYLVDLETKATDEIGVWRWELGTDFYAFKLKEQTSASLTAAEIYNLGVEEVARIHEEMRTILKTLDYKGDLQDFFTFLQTDPQFYYQNTSSGKQAYINRVAAVLNSMERTLDEFFITKPNEKITIKSLASFRPEITLKKKPSIYYVNAENLKQVPKYMTEVMSYHNAIPGHRLQGAIVETLVHLPRFRRLENASTAYVEGWGMYAAYLSKEMGGYQAAYSDFGRLNLELWNACHLVVDVGIHDKKWTKQKAIDYYKKNTPNSAAECLKMVAQQIVLPTESIRCKIGMITILELRKRAELELGTHFNLREFHEVLLSNGNVPLDVLQDLVEEYIQTKKN